MTSDQVRGAQGYVTEVAYPFQHHPDLDPTRHEAALIPARLQRRDLRRPFAYLELGCGSGFTLAALAAAHPAARFLGVDLNPAHTERLGGLAADAGLGNLAVVTASFDALDIPRLGRFDVVAAHGVWSWISASSRAAVAGLLDSVLNERGLFYLSYNCLPGMAALEPLRTLLLSAAPEAAGIEHRVRAGVELVGHALAAESAFLAEPRVRARAEALLGAPIDYVAHEYFNRDWTAFYHRDVAAALAPVGLSFAGSTRLADGLEAARFTPEQQALFAAADRETLKDFVTNRTFRTDLFARGRKALSEKAWAHDLTSRRFVSLLRQAPPDGAPRRYRLVLEALHAQALTMAEVVSAVGARGGEAGEIRAIVIELMAMEMLAIALPREGERERRVSCGAFNRAVLARARGGEALPGLASPVTGGVFVLSPDEMLALAAGDAPEPGLAARLRALELL